ncbi:DUF421 domain-containing protein [Sporomusaceae bacterium FL31]|nr:DUF421 domain-containing protein [Sporomusaceae bacterium FL31]GCE34486.1 DUF421 domain-containing protein [Sporomusaceae bacterium]
MINLDHVYEAIWHTLISFIYLLFLTRIMGRKQIAQLTFFDYVTGISIGSIAAVVAVDQSIELDVLIASLSVWTICMMITNFLTKNSVPARKIIDSHPVVVIHNGKILEEQLGRMHYNIDDLLMQLRIQSVFDPSEVELGIMEPNGELSVKKRPQFSTVTNQDLNIIRSESLASEFTGRQLVVDGIVIDKELKTLGVSTQWLVDQLKLQGVVDITDILVASIKPDGTLYIDKKIDNLNPILNHEN